MTAFSWNRCWNGRSQAGRPATDPGTLEYDAVLLAGFGGPEGPDDVMPFLRNVTRGRGIPDERLVEVSHHYLALDGISPINEQNRRLRAALEAELRRGVRLPVLWGNRNWAPFLADVLTHAADHGQVRLLGLATSAYSSYSGCRQYREDFGLALQSTGLVGSVVIDKVRPYYDQPGFLQPFIDDATGAVDEALSAGIALTDLEVVFTTHSIPMTMARTAGSASLGDHDGTGAYVNQHLAVCRVVVAALDAHFDAGISWQLAYQSRSGPPSMPWLEPDINDVISELAGAGRKGVIVTPIGLRLRSRRGGLGSRQRGTGNRCDRRPLVPPGRHARYRSAVRLRAGRPRHGSSRNRLWHRASGRHRPGSRRDRISARSVAV